MAETTNTPGTQPGNRAAQQKNFAYVEENAESLRNLYLNKYLLVNEERVIGSFDSFEAAAQEGIAQFGTEGDFIVYQASEANEVNFVLSERL